MSDVDEVGAFDRTALIERLEGDEELMVEIVCLFIEDSPGQVAAVAAAVSGGVAVDIQRAAHSLKGASANVGAPQLRQTSLAIEQAAEAGDMQEASRLCERLRGELVAFEAAVKAQGILD